MQLQRLANIKGIPKENFYLPLSSRCNFFLIFDIFPTLPLPPSDPSVAPDTSVIISLVELRQHCSSTQEITTPPKQDPGVAADTCSSPPPPSPGTQSIVPKRRGLQMQLLSFGLPKCTRTWTFRHRGTFIDVNPKHTRLNFYALVCPRSKNKQFHLPLPKIRLSSEQRWVHQIKQVPTVPWLQVVVLRKGHCI